MCASHRQIGLIITISRKTYVTDGDVSYKLVRTGNIPIGNYLLSQSLKPGESISGFFRITRPKKVNHFSVTVNMDSYSFVFTGYVQ